MSQNTANNKDSFDIDFSDLLVQEIPADNTKTEALNTGGLSAEDLSFLESLSQTPASATAVVGMQNLETKDVESQKSEVPQETSKTVLHSSLTDSKAPNPTLNDNMGSNKDAINKGVEDVFAAPAPKKSTLFGVKDKGRDKGKKATDVFAKAPQKTKLTVKKQDLNKPIVLILGVMAVILVLGLLWVFLGKSEESAPTPEPTPIETQAPAPEPTPEVTETPEAPVDTAGTAEGTTAENTATPAPTGDFTPIDADAIVQAEIPDDPALIKEEIDRLADENSRLLDQAKDIDGILSDTEKLTAAKEEQIALLEAQIAQLEAQKGK